MQTIGKVLSRHRKNASLGLVMFLLGGLFLACAVLLAAIQGKAAPEGRAMIAAVMAGAALLGLALCAAGWWSRRRGVMVLGEQGVRVEQGGQSRSYAFGQLAETCQMYRANISVGLAFRSADGPWESANAHLTRYGAFRLGLLDGYIEARLPGLLAILRSGGTVPFKVTTGMGKLQESFSLGIHAYVGANTEQALLTSSSLTLRGQLLDISDVVDCALDPYSTQLRLLRVDGSQAALTYTEFFEPELLTAVLKQLRADAI